MSDNLKSIFGYELCPTQSPTIFTQFPTNNPTNLPTNVPSTNSTNYPTLYPSTIPSINPTIIPTQMPSNTPLINVTNNPTEIPSYIPSKLPTNVPTNIPTNVPTQIPSKLPSITPTFNPTIYPTTTPSLIPSKIPSNIPTIYPSLIPSEIPSIMPTNIPSLIPTFLTNIPTINPTPIFLNSNNFTSIFDANLTQIINILSIDLFIWAKNLINKLIDNNFIYFCIINNVRSGSVIIDYIILTQNDLIMDNIINNITQKTNISLTANGITLKHLESRIITLNPTKIPTNNSTQTGQTLYPTIIPSLNPSNIPTLIPTNIPSKTPSSAPSYSPTLSPTPSPSNAPTPIPSDSPTPYPTSAPTISVFIDCINTQTNFSNPNIAFNTHNFDFQPVYPYIAQIFTIKDDLQQLLTVNSIIIKEKDTLNVIKIVNNSNNIRFSIADDDLIISKVYSITINFQSSINLVYLSSNKWTYYTTNTITIYFTNIKSNTSTIKCTINCTNIISYKCTN